MRRILSEYNPECRTNTPKSRAAFVANAVPGTELTESATDATQSTYIQIYSHMQIIDIDVISFYLSCVKYTVLLFQMFLFLLFAII